MILVLALAFAQVINDPPAGTVMKPLRKCHPDRNSNWYTDGDPKTYNLQTDCEVGVNQKNGGVERECFSDNMGHYWFEGSKTFGSRQKCNDALNRVVVTGTTVNVTITSPEPSAQPTDGTEPTFTTEPVTQQVPHCKPWEKLEQFDPGPQTNAIIWGENPVQDHLPRWVEVGTDTDTVFRLLRTFRCFPDPDYKEPVLPTSATDSAMCAGDLCLDTDPPAVRMGKRWSAFLPKDDPKPGQYMECELMTPGSTLFFCQWHTPFAVNPERKP